MRRKVEEEMPPRRDGGELSGKGFSRLTYGRSVAFAVVDEVVPPMWTEPGMQPADVQLVALLCNSHLGRESSYYRKEKTKTKKTVT